MSTKPTDISVKEYQVNSHLNTALVNALNDQRSGDRFCDAVLIADGRKFNTHK